MNLIDASAILAMLRDESGGDRLAQYLDDGLIAQINRIEVVQFFVKLERSFDEAEGVMAALALNKVVLNEAMEARAAQMVPFTKQFGLGIGDRICLATASVLEVPVVTADRDWNKVKWPLLPEIIQLR